MGKDETIRLELTQVLDCKLKLPDSRSLGAVPTPELLCAATSLVPMFEEASWDRGGLDGWESLVPRCMRSPIRFSSCDTLSWMPVYGELVDVSS